MQENTSLHIGKIICEQLEKDGRKKKLLAQQLNCTLSCLCKILKNDSIRTDMLLQISLVCKHNFAEYISNCYKDLSKTK